MWQKSHRFVLDVYRVSKEFPTEERYGLTNQVRRAAVSIPSNIAEGCGREGDAELARFLQISMGSASELEYQLLLAHELEFVESQTYSRLNESVCEIKRMLASFIKTLRQHQKTTKKS